MSTVRTVAKNTSALFVAEMISRAISIFYVAILARYIQVEGMGAISTAQAVSSALIVLVSFGFDQLITRDVAADKGRAGVYTGNVAVIRLLLSGVYFVAVGVMIQQAHYAPQLAIIIYLYAINAVIKTFIDIALSLFQAFEQMQYNLFLRVIRDGLNVAFSLLAIYLHYSLIVIVSVSALASLVQLVMAYFVLRRKFIIGAIRLDLGLARQLIVRAVPFAVLLIYPVAQYTINTLLLSVQRTIVEVGSFGAASNLIEVLMMIPTLFIRAMFPVFAKLGAKSGHGVRGSLQDAYGKSFNYLFLLSVAVSIGTFVSGEQVIRLIYGPGFSDSVAALRILAWLPIFSFVNYVNGSLMLASGKERFFVVTEGIFALLSAVLSVILTTRFGYLGSCTAILGSTIVTFCFYTVLCHRLLNLRLPLKTGGLAILAGLLMGGCVAYALQQGVNLFVVVLLIGPAVYGLALLMSGAISTEDLALLRQALRIA